LYCCYSLAWIKGDNKENNTFRDYVYILDFFFSFLLLKEICSLYVYAGKIYSGKKKLMEKYTLLWQILELRET